MSCTRIRFTWDSGEVSPFMDFGEAANAYFNKDVGSLTAAEAALLAGVIRGPNLYSPYKYPARALERRNFVLKSMKDLGMLTPEEAEKASPRPWVW